MFYNKVWMPFIFAAFFAYHVSGQNAPTSTDNFAKTVDFLPPAPNAAAIAKAGFFSLNKNTGAPSINIPLISAKDTKLSVSVGINYASSGIKVDEVPARVGLGWSLNAGGVVSRVVRGNPDEGHIRINPWGPFAKNWSTYGFCRRVSESNTFYGYDSEPDFFNFNFMGYSGGFVLDSSMHPVLVPAGNFKIDVNLGVNIPWNIKIVTADGVTYFFGGSSATEKTKRTSTCGKSFEDYIQSSWYLTKVLHPSGEEISFTYSNYELEYDAGISETLSKNTGYEGFDCPTGSSMNPQIQTCRNIQHTQGVLLTTININDNSKIDFEYIDQGTNKEKLLNLVSYSSLVGTSTSIKSYQFSYSMIDPSTQYSNSYAISTPIPYLVKITELGSTGSEIQSHEFGYIDPSGRPPRLSFAQDHWGYFNGKNNTTLLPPLVGELISQTALVASMATSDRSPDFNYACKGMLNKIVYPTGGIEQIIYEPNTVSREKEIGTLHEYSCSVEGSGNIDDAPVYKNINFSIDKQQTVKIDVETIAPGWNFNPYPGSIEVTDIYGNIVHTLEYNIEGVSKTIQLYGLAPGNYVVKIMARTQYSTTTATVKYYPSISFQAIEEQVGGVRVKELLKGNKTESPMVKRYFYGELNSLNKSSANTVFRPTYQQDDKSRTGYILMLQGTPSQAWLRVCYGIGFRIVSNSLMNLFNYSGSTVSYYSVVESEGENFENGGTQYKFLIRNDQPGENVWGRDLISSTFNNYSIYGNGKPLEEVVFRRNKAGITTILKRNLSEYEFDSRLDLDIPVYMVNKKWENTIGIDTTCVMLENNIIHCQGSTDSLTFYDSTRTNINPLVLADYATSGFDIMRYHIFSPWCYLKKTTETVYDENGQNPVTNVTNYYYDNIVHQQLTRTETEDSKGDLLTTTNKYPIDYLGDPVCSAMVSANVIAALVDSKTTKTFAGTPNIIDMSEQKITYKAWPGKSIDNSYFDMSTMSASVKGNPLSVEGTINQRDKKGNILEYEGKDGIINTVLWSYNSLFPIAKIAGANYAFVKGINPNVNYENLTENSAIDEALENIRVHLPKKSMMTSYRYSPFVGVTSIFDPNGKSIKYSYDAAGRLAKIFDQDNKLIKQVEYAYAGSDINNDFGIYYNDALTVPVKCGPCSSGTTGVTINYSIPARICFSLTSVADANENAKADAQARFQQDANLNGKCTNADVWCSGDGIRKVGCDCEKGVLECTGIDTTYPGPGYRHNVRYKWSDGVYGPVFQIILETDQCTPPTN